QVLLGERRNDRLCDRVRQSAARELHPRLRQFEPAWESAHERSDSAHGAEGAAPGLAGEEGYRGESRETRDAVSHRARIGFTAAKATSAVVKFITMLIANTGDHEPYRS